MWTKTLNVKFKKQPVQVLLYLSGDNGDDVTVSMQSMLNEYFLIEDISFKNRDAAYDFIKHYPASMALAFVTRTAYENVTTE